MPPLALLPVHLPAVESVRTAISTRLTSTWSGASPQAPAPPPRSADLFMILFVSIFLFLTAAVLRLVPWVTPLPPHPRWTPRETLPYSPAEADALRGYRSFAPYGALEGNSAAAGGAVNTYEALLEIGERIGNAKHGLTDDQIAILPTYECQHSVGLHDESRRGAKCAVCRDLYKEADCVCLLPCGDEFHRDCIAPWLRQQASCPLCRCRFA